MRWYSTKNGFGGFGTCGLDLWKRLAQVDSSAGNGQQIPASLRIAARCLIECHERCVNASKFEYMYRDPERRVIPVEQHIVSGENKLLFYDICHRTNKMTLLERDTRVKLTAPLFLMLSSCVKNYKRDISRCMMKKFKKQLSAVYNLVSSDYQSDFNSHVTYAERLLHSSEAEAPCGSGLAAVMATQLSLWKQTALRLHDAITEFNESGSLTPETCIPLTSSDAMVHLKRTRISGVTIAQEQSTCLRLTLETGEQAICYNQVNPAFLKAATFANHLYGKHFKNVTTLSSTSLFLMQRDSSTKPSICIASLASQLVCAQILTVEGFLRQRRLSFKDVRFTVDDDGLLIVLNILGTTNAAPEITEGTEETEETGGDAEESTEESTDSSGPSGPTARSVDLNGKLSLALSSREYRYWICRVMGADDDTARRFAQLTPYQLEKYMVHDY